jgi:hypothetical protein
MDVRLAISGLVILFSAAIVWANPVRVYHVGNSVTDTINFNSMQQMAALRGYTYTFGRHTIPGTPLGGVWSTPAGGFTSGGFGYYPQALPNNEWDAVTLQPFDRQLRAGDSVDGDFDQASNFINLTKRFAANSDTRFYIYARWPRRPSGPNGEYLPLNYQQLYDRRYTGQWDTSYETRDYFWRLASALASEFKDDTRIRIVPVGHVLYELDLKMEAGLLPGYTDITDLFTDHIHMNHVGSYVVAETFFATLFDADPRGMAVTGYGSIDPLVVTEIQNTVHNIVRVQNATRVSIPEPTTALLAALPWLLARRRV